LFPPQKALLPGILGTPLQNRAHPRSLLLKHLPKAKAQLLPNLAPNIPHQPRKHLPRILFLEGRFLPNKSLNKALLRVNLSSQAPRKQERQHPPLQNWLNFFRGGEGKNCKGCVLSRTGPGGVLGEAQSPGLAGLVYKHPDGVFYTGLAEFHANCKATNGVVTSEVNGKKFRFDAKKLGVPAVAFDVYVREDKSVLGTARLLELA